MVTGTVEHAPSLGEVERAVRASWDLEEGDVLGRLEIQGVLGEGGFGRVLAAFDPDLDRRVAVKVLRPSLFGSASVEGAKQRLMREARAMAKLSHPNVLAVYDVGAIGDAVYVVMEYAERGTLREWLAAEKRGWREILAVFREAGLGLAAAHAIGLVHRDFKPDNVLLGADGRVRVADFGLVGTSGAAGSAGAATANDVELSLTRSGAAMGTPAYMAPEQHRGESVDARADQFAFCVALWQALYGTRPFPGDTPPALMTSVLSGEIAEPSSDSPVPSHVREALRVGLRVERDERFASMDALLAALSPEAARPRKWLSPARAGLLGMLLLVIAALVYSTGDDDPADPDPAPAARSAGSAHAREAKAGHFEWCTGEGIETLDPGALMSSTATQVSRQLFDGLTTPDARGLPQPSLAASWSGNDEGTRFEFRLRPDATWSDGRPITAHDFVFSVTRQLYSELETPWSQEGLGPLENARLFAENGAFVLLRPQAGLEAGTIVAVDEPRGETSSWDDHRRARRALDLRSEPSLSGETYGSLDAGSAVVVLDLRGEGCDPLASGSAGCDTAFVYDLAGDRMGWVPLADLDPTTTDRVRVRPLDEHRAYEVSARELLRLPQIVGIRASDAQTLVFELEEPAWNFAERTLNREFWPVPRHALAKHGREWTDPNRIVTSGPFHLVGRSEGELRLAKSKDFWGAAGVRLESVTVRMIPDDEDVLASWQAGRCDATTANLVGPEPAREAVSAGRLAARDVVREPYLGTYLYMFNVERLPNAHLRRALALAIDRDRLPESGFASRQLIPGISLQRLGSSRFTQCADAHRARTGEPLSDLDGRAAVLIDEDTCYIPPHVSSDPERARQLLARAREEMGAEFPARITLAYNELASHEALAREVARQWTSTLGLDIEVVGRPWKEFLRETHEGAYDVFRFGWIGTSYEPMEFMGLFSCTAPENRTQACNERVDEMLGASLRAESLDERLRLLWDAESLMIEEAFAIPVYTYAQHVLRRHWVRGLAVNPVDRPSLREVWIDTD